MHPAAAAQKPIEHSSGISRMNHFVFHISLLGMLVITLLLLYNVPESDGRQKVKYNDNNFAMLDVVFVS
jgi:hypothetical protein